jgi:hypothetical protein
MAEADRACNTLDKRQADGTLPPALNQGSEPSEFVQLQTPTVSPYSSAQETARSQSHSPSDNANIDPWKKKLLLTLGKLLFLSYRDFWD